jgi:hypothetical protein
VSTSGLDGNARAAIVARARGFVGPFGSDAVLAVLSGVPAVVLASSFGEREQRDAQLVSSFLRDDPFGRLQVVEDDGSPAEIAARIVSLLGAETLVSV